MVDVLIFICVLASFSVTLLLVPKWIKKAENMGLLGRDMNKPGKPQVPEAGGVSIIAGVVLGLLLYIFLYTFYFKSDFGLIEIFAVLVTLLMAGFVGFIDDILGWKIGMRQRTKIISTLPIAIPLAVVNAGHSTMVLPLLGTADLGFLFPLLVVPLGIVGAINGYNMLAGYNGLETGMGIIILSTLGFIAWQSGAGWIAMLSLIMVSSLLAFLFFNRVPSRVFPGDSLTYSVGAMIACIAIIGNMEKFVLLLFIPYFFDALMFIRFRFIDKAGKIEAFARVNRDGSLELPYKKVYDFTHLMLLVVKSIKKKCYEKDLVASVLIFELAISLAVLWIWFTGI